MLVKAYLDGGNQPDSTQYETVTLAALVGRLKELRQFERGWRTLLNKHGAPYVHTTDIVTFNNDFEKGWDETRRDAFLQDCAKLLRESCAVHSPTMQPFALLPYTITVVLKDLKRIQADFPNLPHDATEILAVNAAGFALDCFQKFEAHFLELHFDRNEPFIGHVRDRLKHGRFTRDTKREDGLDLSRILSIGEADSRFVPALQAADLLAYSVGSKDNVRFGWQKAVLDMDRIKVWFDYSAMATLDAEQYYQNSLKYKFPRRKPTR